MIHIDCEDVLKESLDELLKANKPLIARKNLEQVKGTFSLYNEYDKKLRKLETKHE
jgi:hypothetical protein